MVSAMKYVYIDHHGFEKVVVRVHLEWLWHHNQKTLVKQNSARAFY